MRKLFNYLVDGHFLLLPIMNAFEEESCADFATPFINTTGTCLQLKYLQLFKDTKWLLQIFLRSEELDMALIKTLQYSVNVNSEVSRTWQTLFVRLPNNEGLQQVVVKIARPQGQYQGGLAIDDFTIRPCEDFSRFLLFIYVVNIYKYNLNRPIIIIFIVVVLIIIIIIFADVLLTLLLLLLLLFCCYNYIYFYIVFIVINTIILLLLLVLELLRIVTVIIIVNIVVNYYNCYYCCCFNCCWCCYFCYCCYSCNCCYCYYYNIYIVINLFLLLALLYY